jgi:hypothetical protein
MRASALAESSDRRGELPDAEAVAAALDAVLVTAGEDAVPLGTPTRGEQVVEGFWTIAALLLWRMLGERGMFRVLRFTPPAVEEAVLRRWVWLARHRLAETYPGMRSATLVSYDEITGQVRPLAAVRGDGSLVEYRLGWSRPAWVPDTPMRKQPRVRTRGRESRPRGRRTRPAASRDGPPRSDDDAELDASGPDPGDAGALGVVPRRPRR